MSLLIYTGREGDVANFQPWQWHRFLAKEMCPQCEKRVYLEMLEFGYCYQCVHCMVTYFMPMLGFGPQMIWRTEPSYRSALNYMRRAAYHHVCDLMTDDGRSIKTGRFVKWPSLRSYARWGWQRAFVALERNHATAIR